MHNAFLFFLSVSFTIIASAHAQTSRVVGGSDADENKYPWMAALISANDIPSLDLIFCGGTLVDDRYLLTAAHCLFDGFGDELRARSIQAIVGRTVLSTGKGTQVNVERIIIHPDYNDNRFVPLHDIALLRLGSRVAGDTLTLATSAESSITSADTSAAILGWGIANADALQVFPDNLQEGTVSIFSDAFCEQRYGLIFQGSNMVCAAELSSSTDAQDGVDTCNGDSGGPLLVDDSGTLKQVGITSFGFRCEDVEFPSGYTEVGVYEQWVRSIIDSANAVEDALDGLSNLLKRLSRTQRRTSLRSTLVTDAQNRLSVLSSQSASDVTRSFPSFASSKISRLQRFTKRLRNLRNSPRKRRAALRGARRIIRSLKT